MVEGLVTVEVAGWLIRCDDKFVCRVANGRCGLSRRDSGLELCERFWEGSRGFRVMARGLDEGLDRGASESTVLRRNGYGRCCEFGDDKILLLKVDVEFRQ